MVQATALGRLGLLYGSLCTYEDDLRSGAHAAIMKGGDVVYCAASMDTITRLAAEGIRFIPSKAVR